MLNPFLGASLKYKKCIVAPSREAREMRLRRKAQFEIAPVPPFDFRLTVKKPAGWDLFTSDEAYEEGTLWTGIRFEGRPLGLKIQSLGTVEKPRVLVGVYSARGISREDPGRLRSALSVCLGADQDLSEFYEFARKDEILRHVVESLYGMHDTQGVSLFNSVILAICLQMARLKRSMEMMEAISSRHGQTIQFDGRSVRLQPTAARIAKLDPLSFAKGVQAGLQGQVHRGVGEDDRGRVSRHAGDNGDGSGRGEGQAGRAPGDRGLRGGHHQPARGVPYRRVVSRRLRAPLLRQAAGGQEGGD
jgi:hypothetical protein